LLRKRNYGSRRAPPAPVVPFAQQQQALQANPGQPLPNTTLNQMRVQNNPSPQARPQYRQAMPNAAVAPPAPPQAPTQVQAPPPVQNNAPRIMRREDVGNATGSRSGNAGPLTINPPVNAPVNAPVNPPAPVVNNPPPRREVQQAEPRVQAPPQRVERVEPVRPNPQVREEPRQPRPERREEKREEKRDEKRGPRQEEKKQ